MISYQTYKLITESAFTLGLKSRPSLGLVGSKLQEMGFEKDDDPEMLDDEMGDFPPDDAADDMGMEDPMGGEMEDEHGFPCPACNAEGQEDEGMEGCEACGGLGWLPPEEGEMGDEEMGDLDGAEEDMGDGPPAPMGGDKKPGEELMFSKKFMTPDEMEDENEERARGFQSRNRGYRDSDDHPHVQIGGDDDDVHPDHRGGSKQRFRNVSDFRSSRPAAMGKFMHKDEGKKFMGKSCCGQNMKEEAVTDDFIMSLRSQAYRNTAKQSSGLAEDMLVALGEKPENAEPGPGEVGFAPQQIVGKGELGGGFSMDDFKELPTLGEK